jgi:hypothetical protein
MTLHQHIWNHFVLSGRLEEARNEPQPPSSRFKDFLAVTKREFPKNHSEILENFSEYLMKNSFIPEDHLYHRINNLVAQEKFCDALLLPKIEPKKIVNLINIFSTKNFITSQKKCGDTVWTIPTKRYDIEIVFEKYGKFKGLHYSLKVFPKNEKRIYSTCLFSFWSGVLLGCCVDTWDLIFDDDELISALSTLWKNCQYIHEALDSYNLEI